MYTLLVDRILQGLKVNIVIIRVIRVKTKTMLPNPGQAMQGPPPLPSLTRATHIRCGGWQMRVEEMLDRSLLSLHVQLVGGDIGGTLVYKLEVPTYVSAILTQPQGLEEEDKSSCDHR